MLCIRFKNVLLILESMEKQKLLLHVCCGPCATEVIERLKDKFDLSLFFYNPNIHPKKEWNKRLKYVKKIADIYGLELYIHEQDDGVWFKKTEGMENEPEGGKRCEVCFDMRLDTAARFAKDNGFDAFTTTLSISPYKNHFLIVKLGNKIAEEYGIEFIDDDFKKKQGYKKSIELSKKYKLYRQKYCGCLYSMH